MPSTPPPPDPPPRTPSPTSPTTPTTHLRALAAHRTALESALTARLAALTTAGAPPGTPLVDAEGFPRADIDDLPTIARYRQEVVVMGNDLKDANRRMASALERVHAYNRERDQGQSDIAQSQSQPQSESTAPPVLTPFARIDGVAPSSPAAAAGLQRDDLLLRIGHLTASSLSASSRPGTINGTASVLAPLAPLVSSHENRALELEILRPSGPSSTGALQQGSRTLTLTLVPRSGWGGRGLLGCHIVPYTTPIPPSSSS